MKRKTKTERSAGGLVVTNTAGTWWILLMKDKAGNWTFPKGKREKGEKALATAKREIREEVGITGLTLLHTLPESRYWYYRDGAVKKTVQYFLFSVAKKSVPVVQTEEGITEADWVPLAEAPDRIGYPETNRPLLAEAEKILC